MAIHRTKLFDILFVQRKPHSHGVMPISKSSFRQSSSFYLITITTCIYVVFATFVNACASVIMRNDQTCHVNQDCTWIYTSCACATCDAVVSAINTKFVNKYKSLSQCSKKEIARCAVIDCVVKRYTAFCKNGFCEIETTYPDHP